MAVGTIVRKTLVNKLGQEYYQYRRAGKFVSAAAYRAQQWRRRGGKAGTALRRNRAAAAERFYRSEWGAPPAGWTWKQIVSKYTERFEDYLEPPSAF